MSEYEKHEESVSPFLGERAVWADPPGDIEPRILASIAEEISPGGPRRRHRIALTAAAVLIVTLFGVLAVTRPWEESATPGTAFALEGTVVAPGASATAMVGAADAGWWIHLTVDGLLPAPDGSYYEGWVSDGTNRVSVGTFHMREGDYVALWSGVPVSDFPFMTVTLQTVDGDDSTDVVLRGSLPAPTS